MSKNNKYLILKLLLLAVCMIFIARGLVKTPEPRVEPKPAPAPVTITPPAVSPVDKPDVPLEPQPEPAVVEAVVDEPELDLEPMEIAELPLEPEVVIEEPEPVVTNEPSLLDEMFPEPETNVTEVVEEEMEEEEEPVVTNEVVEVEAPASNEVAVVEEEIIEEEPIYTNAVRDTARSAIPIIIERATTRGRVVLLEDSDDERHVVKDVPMSVWYMEKNKSEQLMFKTRTDEDGMFSIPELRVGIYRIVVGVTPMLMEIVPPVTKLKAQERAAPKALLIMMPKHAI